MDTPDIDRDEAALSLDVVERLRNDLAEERRRALRLRADLENFRRRAGRENEMAARDGQRTALLPLLPVLDALDRALAAGSTDERFYEGVASTRRLLVQAFREAGAEALETVGHPFDPALHEAVATVAAEDGPPGLVVREVRPGWRLDGGDLLRPAQVVVSVLDESFED